MGSDFQDDASRWRQTAVYCFWTRFWTWRSDLGPPKGENEKNFYLSVEPCGVEKSWKSWNFATGWPLNFDPSPRDPWVTHRVGTKPNRLASKCSMLTGNLDWLTQLEAALLGNEICTLREWCMPRWADCHPCRPNWAKLNFRGVHFVRLGEIQPSNPHPSGSGWKLASELSCDAPLQKDMMENVSYKMHFYLICYIFCNIWWMA